MWAPRFSIVTPVYETPAGGAAGDAAVGSPPALRRLGAVPRRRRLDRRRTSPRARGGRARRPAHPGQAPRRQRRHRRGVQRRPRDGPRRVRRPARPRRQAPPDALASVAEAIDAEPEADYVYTDEDKIDRVGLHFGPFFKPDWSPERMRTQMYTCHLSVLRRSLVEEVGGFDPEFEGSQDWDLVLKVTERAGASSTSRVSSTTGGRSTTSAAGGGESAKPWAFEAGARAVQAHCERIGLQAARRARRGAARRLPPATGAHRRAEGEHRDPDQRAAARGALRGGDAGRALRAQHRRDLHLLQLRDRLRRRHLDRTARGRRADGDRRRPPAARHLRGRVQLLGQDQPRGEARRGGAAAAPQRRHGGRHAGLDRAHGDVRAASGDRRRRRPPALGGRPPPARRGRLRGRSSRARLPRLQPATTRATRTTPTSPRTTSP